MEIKVKRIKERDRPKASKDQRIRPKARGIEEREKNQEKRSKRRNPIVAPPPLVPMSRKRSPYRQEPLVMEPQPEPNIWFYIAVVLFILFWLKI